LEFFFSKWVKIFGEILPVPIGSLLEGGLLRRGPPIGIMEVIFLGIP